MTLWTVQFLSLVTFGIQPRLDEYLTSAPNAYVNNIANHFAGLYPLIVGGVTTSPFSSEKRNRKLDNVFIGLFCVTILNVSDRLSALPWT